MSEHEPKHVEELPVSELVELLRENASATGYKVDLKDTVIFSAAADALQRLESKLGVYQSVVEAALAWRATRGIPNNEVNERLLEALDALPEPPK